MLRRPDQPGGEGGGMTGAFLVGALVGWLSAGGTGPGRRPGLAGPTAAPPIPPAAAAEPQVMRPRFLPSATGTGRVPIVYSQGGMLPGPPVPLLRGQVHHLGGDDEGQVHHGVAVPVSPMAGGQDGLPAMPVTGWPSRFSPARGSY